MLVNTDGLDMNNAKIGSTVYWKDGGSTVIKSQADLDMLKYVTWNIERVE